MLSKIGSFIENPLFADGATAEFSRISFVRLYIKIDVDKEVSNHVPLVNERGQEFLQRVEYEGIPPKCSHCKLFGHDVEHCRFGGSTGRIERQKEVEVMSQVWVPNAPVEGGIFVEQVDELEKKVDSIVDSIIH
ncbi:hypothetical protein LIER_25000 [Lithospermum erythrorhizon]|uniref:Uncharacterized protein n=1 Tax=Lithospermum erythrorhizon TaxID=34254 RepID=A0AAV3R368_LITER